MFEISVNQNKKFPYIFLLIIGVIIIIAGVVFNPSFVASHLSSDGVLEKATIVGIYIVEVLTISLGFIASLCSALKITNSASAKKIDEMNPFSRIKVPSFVKIFFVADFTLALTYLANIILGQPIELLNGTIDLDRESNIPNWYSSMKLSFIAVLLVIFAYHKFERKNRESWILLFIPIPFFGLSLEEIVGFHEWLTQKLLLLSHAEWINSIFPNTSIWFLLGVPFLGLMLILGKGARGYLRNRPHVSIKYLIGLILLIGSATGIEIISNFVIGNKIAHTLQVLCEELGEMLGGSILLWATYDLLISYHFSIISANE